MNEWEKTLINTEQKNKNSQLQIEINLLNHQTYLVQYFIFKKNQCFSILLIPPKYTLVWWNLQNQRFPLSSISHNVVNHYI